MTQDQIDRILAALNDFRVEVSGDIAGIKTELKGITDENDKADIVHDKLDARVSKLERSVWMAVGYLSAGAGVGSAITVVLAALR